MSGDISPSLFPAVFHHSLDAVFLTRADGVIEAANQAACDLLGLTEDAICARGRAGIVDPESPELDGMLADQRERDGTSQAELLYVHRDGTRIPVEVSSAAFTDDTGEAWTVVIARDTRERMQAQEFLTRSRLLLETVVNSTEDFIWLVSPEDFAILWHNLACAKSIAGPRASGSLVGLRPQDLYDDQNLIDFWHRSYGQALTEGTAHVDYHVAGGPTVLALTLTAIERNGAILGISVFGRDTTEAVQSRLRLVESEARYRTIVDTISEGVVFQAADGTILEVNPAAERIEDRDEHDMLVKDSEDPQWGAVRADGTPFPGEDHPAMVTLRTGEPQRDVVMGIATPRGERRWIMINSAPVFDSNGGAPTAAVTTFRDITEQRLVAEEVRIAAIAFDASQEAMVIADANTTILRVNRAFTELTGYSPDEAVGQSTRLLSSGHQGPAFYRKMWQALTTEHFWQGEIWDRRSNGEVYPCWLRITAVTDDAGTVTHYIATSTDLSDVKAAQQDMLTLTFHDPLTGLPNRRLLLDRLELAVITSANDDRRGALISIDLDAFTMLNETSGHAAGDRLLTTVSERLSAQVGSEGTVARLGSDEFAVLLQRLDPDPDRAVEQAQEAADGFRAAVGRPLAVEGQEYQCRISVGIAMFGQGEPDAGDLLRHADLALTLARREGPDRVQFYNREVEAALEDRVRLESDLRKGIPHNLRLVFQPQVTAAGVICGAEALVRWHDPVRGVVSPGDFIDLAEENGLILPLGQWVLETACRQLAAWQRDPRTQALTMSVNISGRQLHLADFTDTVLTAVAEAGADPAGLRLELTESVLTPDMGDLAVKMNRLRDHGVLFSLDDFGTGFSSLRRLRNLPIHELKIDQSFVRHLPDDANDLAIARTIIALGRGLGLAVIAEGVENPGQREALTDLGCTSFQGYLFARPLPIEDFMALVDGGGVLGIDPSRAEVDTA